MPATRVSSTPTSRTSTRDDVAVVGAGMAAATEWRNALAAGAGSPPCGGGSPLRRPLNVPRPLLLTPRARRASTRRRGARVALRSCALLAPSYPPGREWDEPLEHGAARPLSRRDRGERRGADHLRHRLPARLRARAAARAARRRPRARDPRATGSCSRPTAPCRRSPTTTHARARRRRRRSGRTRQPTRWSGAKYAAHGFLRRVKAMSYTLRGRLESRLLAALAPLAVAVRPRARRCTAGGRSSSRR